MYKTPEFRAWGQGDYAAEAQCTPEIVPIPAEELENVRDQKGFNRTKRKPAPLKFYGSPILSSKNRHRRNGSIAFQDTALRSATSLISVVSDVFRSPRLSAHQKSLKYDLLDATTHQCRPRAYTAPPIPLVESIDMDPVELPGSMPGDGTSFISATHYRTYGQHLLPNYSGLMIERPHSSPQERTHTTPNKRERVTVESFYRDTPVTPPEKPFQLPLWSDVNSASLKFDVMLPSYDEADATPKLGNKGSMTGLKRPPLSVLPLELPYSSGLSTPLLTSLPGSMDAVPRLEISSQTSNLPQGDTDTTLLDQISNMRVSHDAHLKSLKAAHEKEIAYHEAYVLFLEKRQAIDSSESKRTQTSTTVQSEGLENPVPRTGSFGSSLDLESTLANNDGSVMRELHVYRKDHAEVEQLQKERDQLRAASDISERKILQLKGTVRKIKAQGRALKNAVLNLEARLTAANNERIDVLEGFHEASRQLHSLAQREQTLKDQLEDLRGPMESNRTLTVAPEKDRTCRESLKVSRARHNRTHSDVGAVSTRRDTLVQQLCDLHQIVEEKDNRIRRLEEAKPKDLASEAGDSIPIRTIESDRIRELENEVETYKQLHAVAKSDSERYNSLLHNEMRRQIRNKVDRDYPSIPVVEAEARNVASDKIKKLKAESEADGLSNLAGAKTSDLRSCPLVTSLEREIEHCIREIILYKWDVKGYRKDLKKANAKIENLEGRSDQRSLNADTRTCSNAGNYASPHLRRYSNTTDQGIESASNGQFGLGVSILETPREMENIAQVVTPPPRLSNVTSPPAGLPRTPLSIHKKLPKPPSSTNSSPAAHRHQFEALRPGTRSFSENFIASQTKKTLYEAEDSNRMPLSDPNTPRLHAAGSSLPLSKFASRSFSDQSQPSPLV